MKAPLSRDPRFGKLGREISRFANHAQRSIDASQRHRGTLERASEWTGGAAPLDRRPDSPAIALRAIDQFARIHRENRPALFGAYFAHHQLRLQAELSRALLRESLGGSPRSSTHRRVHARAEAERRAWVSALLETCIAAACPDLAPEDYAAFNVGALTDHEDVDLAIVVTSIDARIALDRGFAAVSKTFLRYASKLQLFVTEQIPEARSAALIEDFEAVVERRPAPVVVLIQLLGARLLAGSRDLARAFRGRITERFYAGSGESAAHERLLRTIAAELLHHRASERLSDLLAPKREIYLPGKLITTAIRCIHGVHEPYVPDALALLSDRHPERAGAYRRLGEAFVESEVLRGLFFTYVAKQDELDLHQPDLRRASRRVALLFGLGFEDRHAPEERLAAAYHELRARAQGAVLELAHDLAEHLRQTPGARRLLRATASLLAGEDNAALGFTALLETLSDDGAHGELIELLESSQALTRRLLDDLAALPEGRRAMVARRWVEGMVADPLALLELLVLAGSFYVHEGGGGEDAGTVAERLWDELLERELTDDVRLDAFAQRLDAAADPEVLHRLAVASPPHRLSGLADHLAETGRSPAVVRALRAAIVLVHHQSNALGRLSSRVLARTPELVEGLLDFERLRALARDLALQAERELTSRRRIELLGDAFDVHELRCALVAVQEGAPGARDREWTAAFDDHVIGLIAASSDAPPPLALYTCGGAGRGEAFAADWDYFAITDSSPGSKARAGDVLRRVEAALVRRGLVPHNRLTQRLDSYAVTIEELASYLADRQSDTFIDEAEILEARCQWGDPDLCARFDAEITTVLLTRGREAFLADLLAELRALRAVHSEQLLIKEGPGGLREIHLCVVALRAHLSSPRPLPPEMLAALGDALPQIRSELRFLAVARAELRRVRDLHRLVVASDEPVDARALVEIARDLPGLAEAGVRPGFEVEIRKLLRASAGRIDRVMAAIEAELAAKRPSIPRSREG